MPAAPFGDHPTLAQYCVWAESQGCSIGQGAVVDENGGPYSVTVINAPSGRWANVVGVQHTEHLVPTMIAWLDRRLDMKSPFFSLPPGDDDPA